MTLDQTTRPIRRSFTTTRWLLTRHRIIVLLWGAAVAAMATATTTGNAPLARLALFAALVALTASMVTTARWVVTRMTQIVALWEEDVPLDDDDNLYPLHRGGRARRGRAQDHA